MDFKNVVKHWLDFSDMDISSAEYMMGRIPKQPEIVCSYGIQASGKALKGYLTSKEQDLLNSDDLLWYLHACEELDSDFSVLNESCQILIQYAVQVKDGSVEDVDRVMAAVVKESRKIYDFVCQKIEM